MSAAVPLRLGPRSGRAQAAAAALRSVGGSNTPARARASSTSRGWGARGRSVPPVPPVAIGEGRSRSRPLVCGAGAGISKGGPARLGMGGAVGTACWTEISISPEAEGAGARMAAANCGASGAGSPMPRGWVSASRGKRGMGAVNVSVAGAGRLPAAGMGGAGPMRVGSSSPGSSGEGRTCTAVVLSLIESRGGRVDLAVAWATSAATARVPAFVCIGRKTRARSSQSCVSASREPSWMARSRTFSARSASPRRSRHSPSQR